LRASQRLAHFRCGGPSRQASRNRFKNAARLSIDILTRTATTLQPVSYDRETMDLDARNV